MQSAVILRRACPGEGQVQAASQENGHLVPTACAGVCAGGRASFAGRQLTHSDGTVLSNKERCISRLLITLNKGPYSFIFPPAPKIL